MKAMVVKSNKGIERGVELTHEQAVELSRTAEVAAVVCMAETMGGRHVVYIGGSMAQYDPVANEITGAHAVFGGRNGWIS